MTTIEFVAELDARGLTCPLPILKTKKALAGLSSGQVLRVQTTDAGAARDFQAFASQTGNELVQSGEEGGVLTFFLRRK